MVITRITAGVTAWRKVEGVVLEGEIDAYHVNLTEMCSADKRADNRRTDELTVKEKEGKC